MGEEGQLGPITDGELISVKLRAKHCCLRLAQKKLYNKRKAARYRDPAITELRKLTQMQWEVMIALEMGALRTSHYTAPGATVGHMTARSLERIGYVEITAGWAQLTPEARVRVERGW